MRKVVLACCAVVALAGCSSSTKVGSEQNLANVGNHGQGRVGQFASGTPTPVAHHRKAHHVHRQQPQTPVQATTTAPVARTTSPAPVRTRAASFAVKIVPAAQGYDPVSFQVVKGTHVVITNTDKVAHTFTADHGAFNSGSIKPGRSWTFIPTKDGTFAFHDDTRPFATGQMLVYG